MKYVKRPVHVEAVKWTGSNKDEILDHMRVAEFQAEFQDDVVRITTLEGVMTAQVGDYIIKGVKGELYPCKPDIFEETYDKVGDFKDRLDAEVRVVAMNAKKLHYFLMDAKLKDIDPFQFRLMQTQLNAMKAYQEILQLRIEHLKGYWGGRTDK